MSNCSSSPKVTYKRKPIAPLISIDQPGRLRFANLMALFGLSHQTIYSRIASGEIPAADGYDGKLPFWFTETIRPLLQRSDVKEFSRVSESQLTPVQSRCDEEQVL